MVSQSALFIWPQRRLFLAHEGFSNAMHDHPAMSLIIALEGSFVLEIPGDQPRHIQACLLAPRCQHRLDAQATPLLVLHADHPDPRFDALRPVFQGHRLVIADDPHCQRLRQLCQQALLSMACCHDAYQLSEALLDTWATTSIAHVDRDPRIVKCLRLIERSLPDPISVEDLAFAVDLSATRLMHVFKREMGMPIRRYVLWVRLRGAVNELKQLGSLTDAAHAMGFADSAHLSRTFSQMFGIPPSQVLNRDRFVQAHFCEDALD